MSLFRKKTRVEDVIESLMSNSVPKAMEFYGKENKKAHRPLRIEASKLFEIGVAMCLFFLARYFPEDKPEDKEKMSRAFKQAQAELERTGHDAQSAYRWWKAYTDALIFQEKETRLRLASRLTWEKLFPEKAYKEQNPLHSYGYMLEIEVDGFKKNKIV